MATTRSGKTIPNNPVQAFLLGVREGTQDNMNLVATTLCDKCGWHIKELTDGEYADRRDTDSIEYFYNAMVALRDEVKSGNIKMLDIKRTLQNEYNAIFED